jgi:hypothetical protein
MPMRNHFANPNRPTWEPVHGGWPMMMVQYLFRILPPRYQILPQVHLGKNFEIDIATFDQHSNGHHPNSHGNGVATQTWTSPEPTLTLEADPLDPDEYEVRIHDLEDCHRLVAAIELVSPSNKDRPEARAAFVTKCAGLLQQEVCVSIVDLVSNRQFNLYAELLELLGRSDPMLGDAPPETYAVTIHRRFGGPRWRLRNWAYPLRIGEPLPSLPIWLNDRDGTMLELESTYEETCRTLRIA